MIPVSYRTPIIQFAIQTDGYGETMWLVYQDENDQNNWILSMDPEDVFLEDGTVDFKELQYTLIHEFGHILTLTNKELWNGAIPAQIVYGPEDEDARMDFVNKCTTYFPWEWCSTKDWYLYAFVQKFWQAEDHQALIESTAMWEEKSEEDQEEFYTNNSEKFLTDYAATNPEEDIAESRTAFILQKKPTDSSLVSNEKILFFYDYDELVALRSSIRAHLFTQK